MASVFFPSPLFPNHREPRSLNPITNLAKAINDVVLLPFRIFTFIFLMPILLPLIVFHSIIVISMNAFVLFSLIAISTFFICAITASEIALPIGALGVCLISLIALSALQRNFEDSFKAISDIFSF